MINFWVSKNVLASDLIPKGKEKIFFSHWDVVIYNVWVAQQGFGQQNRALWIVLIGFVKQLRSQQESKKTVENTQRRVCTPLITVL